MSTVVYKLIPAVPSPRARAAGGGGGHASQICSGLSSLSSAATAFGGMLAVCSAPARRPAWLTLLVQRAEVAV